MLKNFKKKMTSKSSKRSAKRVPCAAGLVRRLKAPRRCVIPASKNYKKCKKGLVRSGKSPRRCVRRSTIAKKRSASRGSK